MQQLSSVHAVPYCVSLQKYSISVLIGTAHLFVAMISWQSGSKVLSIWILVLFVQILMVSIDTEYIYSYYISGKTNCSNSGATKSLKYSLTIPTMAEREIVMLGLLLAWMAPPQP